MVSFYNYFLTCDSSARIADVIGECPITSAEHSSKLVMLMCSALDLDAGSRQMIHSKLLVGSNFPTIAQSLTTVFLEILDVLFLTETFNLDGGIALACVVKSRCLCRLLLIWT